MTQEDQTTSEVDAEWLKSKIEGLEASIANLLSNKSEPKSDSTEQAQTTQVEPSEVQVVQEDQKESPKRNGPKSRLVIRGPKFLTR